MKKIFSFLLIVFFASAISICFGALFCATFHGFLSVSIFGGVFIALCIGAFDENKKEMKL